jgi:hypothetical protein
MYLEAAGIWMPSKDYNRTPRLEARILHLLNNGASLISVSRADVDGSHCIRIEISTPNPEAERASSIDPKKAERDWRAAQVPEDEIARKLDSLERRKHLRPTHIVFFVDPQRFYAPVRYEERSEDGKLRSETWNEDFQQVKGRSLALAHKSHTNYFTWPTVGDKVFDKPMLIREMSLQSVSTESPPDDLFSLSSGYSAVGTRIIDQTALEGSKVLVVPATSEDLDNAIGKPAVLAQDRQAMSWHDMVFIGGGIALVLVAIFCWFWPRRFGSRKVPGE